MNVLQILPELKIGGVERGTVDLARYLIKSDHKAVVISGGGRLVRQLDIIGARHYALPVGKKSIFTMVRMIGKVCEVIKRENIDIVHARSRVPAWTAFIACRIMRCPFVTTAHGYYNSVLTSQVMGWGKYVIVASHVIARRMMNGFKVPYPRIRFIPRGVDLDDFKYIEPHKKREAKQDTEPVPDNSFTIGVISRITPIKGHSYFIRALSIVSRIVPKLRVLIIGEPSPGKQGYKDELELLVKRLGLTRVVEFVGWKEDVAEVLSELDLLVLPTVTQEAFGRVIIEAQARGVPVVATKVGGISELIEDGVNGLLVTPGDVRTLQEAMLKVAKDADLACSLSIEGRKNAEKYSLDELIRKTIAVYRESIESQNILVIKTSALGDVILSVPSVRAIRSRYPNAVIKVLVGKESRQIFKGCPYIDEMIVCDFKRKDRSIGRLLRLGTRLRRCNFDIVVDLQNNRRSHLLSFLSFAPLRFGYDNGKFSFLLNRRVKEIHEHIDPVSHQFRTLSLAGVKVTDKKLELWPQEEEEAWVDAFIKDNWLDLNKHQVVGINPQASKRWLSKSWPIEKVAAFCDEMARNFNIRVIVTGTKEDMRMAKKLKTLTKSKPIIAVGKTDLLQLAALIKRCAVFVTTDSATMHVASAVKTPFVALFGPTDPARHVPLLTKHTVIKTDAACSPCYKSTCVSKGYVCMKSIAVEEVLKIVERYIDRERVTA